MRTIVAVISLLVMLTTLTAVTRAKQSSKPIKEHHIGTYFKGPPDSLREMALDADAVVRGRLLGGSPNDRNNEVFTAFKLKVDEILHAFGGRRVDPSEIVILRRTGDRDRGSYVERTVQENFPAFELGHEYVMYLAWNEPLKAWVPAFGPDSVLDITKGVIESAGRANITSAQRGRSAEDYLNAVRALSR